MGMLQSVWKNPFSIHVATALALKESVMGATKCPNCRVALPQKEMASGWCDACGQKIPLFVYEECGMETPEEHRPFNHLHDAPAREQVMEAEPFPLLQVSLIAVAIVGIAFVIVRAFI
jgi:hypothetical protein